MKIVITKSSILKSLLLILVIIISSTSGFFTNQYFTDNDIELINPLVTTMDSISYPLLQYSIENLSEYDFVPSEILLEELIVSETSYDTYLFSYTTLGKRMTGQINIPDRLTASPTQQRPAIVMLRGYVPKEIYQTGIGTKNAAAVLANNGYITIAPDFFGYGDSDPENKDTWQGRFEKPVIVAELIKSIETNGIPQDIGSENLTVTDIGIWAHSNGGQVALTTLEVLQRPIPTTLWAPVTAPFPYSILYFGDELEDEGKSQRSWVAIFEKKYDVFDFSLTKHLDHLTGPIQLHHGDEDDAALIYWSNEFVEKLEAENERRTAIFDTENEATTEAQVMEIQSTLPLIDISYYKYPDTNHNMVPNWNNVIQRDLSFFNENLK